MTERRPNKFHEWDQDRLRILWMAGIPNYLRKVQPAEADYPRQTSPDIVFAIVKHLSTGRDTRGGIARALKMGEKTVDRAFGDLRAQGRLVKEYNSTLKLWFYSIGEGEE
jgi:hypothetical protein